MCISTLSVCMHVHFQNVRVLYESCTRLVLVSYIAFKKIATRGNKSRYTSRCITILQYEMSTTTTTTTTRRRVQDEYKTNTSTRTMCLCKLIRIINKYQIIHIKLYQPQIICIDYTSSRRVVGILIF